jgi:hypothetical protein
MKRLSSIALTWSLAATIGACAASAQSSGDSASGHWEGVIKAPGQELAVTVDLTRDSNGNWVGAIAIPVQGVKNFALAPVSVDGMAVTFGMKGIPGDPLFKGTVSGDPRAISGEFSQGGMTMPFALVWKGEPKFETPPKSTTITKDLEGSWEGALNVQGTTLRLVLDLSNEGGAGSGTLTSLDQGGAKIPIAQVAQSDTNLKLLVTAVGASYEGTIGNGQIEGTWAQSGQKFPLVFKRASK